jgi:hypothetical protein
VLKRQLENLVWHQLVRILADRQFNGHGGTRGQSVDRESQAGGNPADRLPGTTDGARPEDSLLQREVQLQGDSPDFREDNGGMIDHELGLRPTN